MSADIHEKTDRYERLLADALASVSVAPPDGTPLASAAIDHVEMAAAYLEDGRHFRDRGDFVNALAAFSYGHGWLDAGVRTGLLDAPRDGQLFTI